MSEIAVCKYCGQIQTTEVPENATHSEALEIGTLVCNCPSAKIYQRIMEKADNAKHELRDMLLSDDETHNIKAVDKDIFDFLAESINLMVKDKIYKITLGLNSGGNVDIKIGSGGKISLKRSVAIANKREV